MAAQWRIRPDAIYLNHGSFGPPPEAVRRARRAWIDRLDDEPVDFFGRQLEAALLAARDRLAEFVGTAGENLIFVENATAGMNVAASSFPLEPGDEVLLTDHEYGAVRRIWERACREAGAAVTTADLPLPFSSVEETVAAIFAAATARTRLVVVSHITSPTAVILPVAEICDEARRRGIAVAIDGPHAVAQVPLAIDALGCDFYAASCHKWLSAPFGSGFLYVAPRRQARVRPPTLSWGRIQPTPVEHWGDEFVWTGTRDSSPYLTVPTAIAFLEQIGWERFRARTHWLAAYAGGSWSDLPASSRSFPTIRPGMARWPTFPCRRAASPPRSTRPSHGRAADRQPAARRHLAQLGVEVPIVEFGGRRFIRVSCHLYNITAHIDRLGDGLGRLLARGE